ncbi:ferritin-like domain-containing protein [Hymenobacter gummosus]|uniref:Ferritin-like domain-containing protein n=1 Tax=Hymenobacter gummosus TaxID=1776032 RepID=A0A3S0J9M7_9BACT|nr:ferritin-like domain-containing protein [Hymenobacter gummosus]RTQ49216.1 ferritin-like domain-containing protein [Hymenobacter gummosus]
MPEASSSSSPSTLNRRSFLASAGVATASLLVLAACEDDNPAPTTDPFIALAAGDPGVLSYFYLLERFSAEFYNKVLAAPPTDLTATDLAVLRDLYRHELAHRETLNQVFSANGLTLDVNLPALEFKYDSFTLTTRAGVLSAAQTIEDMGVAALAGAAKLVADANYLQLVLKIMAVEARHAAAIRDLNQAGSFAGADVVPQTGTEAGLNRVLTPTEVLAEFTAKYSPIKLRADNLPTS